jgi:polyisoprenoid-binding protein YceI
MKNLLNATLLAGLIGLSSAATAAPESYTADPTHTFVSFEYNHLGFSNQRSRFDNVKANFTLDTAAKAASVEVTIDPKFVNTGSDKFNQHLQGEDFFDVAKFPTATFKSTKVVFAGDKPSEIIGNLTLKGVTKPVTLKVTNFVCQPHPFTKKDMCGANATTKFKRSEFDLGKFAPAVSDDTTLSIAIEAIKN